MPKKPSGEIGATRVTQTPDKGVSANLDPIALPSSKEELEKYFADRFVPVFNRVLPLGPGTEIKSLKQNDTSGLDFDIECVGADYLELGELAPRDENFGQVALKTGEINVYEFAEWIWRKIIKDKADRYGDALATRTLLLLYATCWQFLPNVSLFECLQSTLIKQGCSFGGVLLLMAGGPDLNHIVRIHPYDGKSLHSPEHYRTSVYVNMRPGTHTVGRSDGINSAVVPFGAGDTPEGEVIIMGGQLSSARES